MRRRSAPPPCGPPPPDGIRCRRSNGKDWRCAEQALPELSYCAYHHHLNYHRPPSDRQPHAGKIADPVMNRSDRKCKTKRKRDLVNVQNLSIGDVAEGAPNRRRKKRRRGEACESETGLSKLSSGALILSSPQIEISGEDPDHPHPHPHPHPLPSPIYEALPVRFHPNPNLSSLLSTGQEHLDMYTSIPVPVPVSVSNGAVQEELRCRRGSVNGPVQEDLRCRRSNGKEWRCGEQALPALSYCAYHHNLNYNRSATKQPKAKGTSRASSKAAMLVERETDERVTDERESNSNNNSNNNNNGVLCKRTNGKGWQCPNLAVEGLSYCPYHHQLNYRGASNNNTNVNNSDNTLECEGRTSGTKIRGDVGMGIIGLDGLLVKRPRNRKHAFFDGLQYAM